MQEKGREKGMREEGIRGGSAASQSRMETRTGNPNWKPFRERQWAPRKRARAAGIPAGAAQGRIAGAGGHPVGHTRRSQRVGGPPRPAGGSGTPPRLCFRGARRRPRPQVPVLGPGRPRPSQARRPSGDQDPGPSGPQGLEVPAPPGSAQKRVSQGEGKGLQRPRWCQRKRLSPPRVAEARVAEARVAGPSGDAGCPARSPPSVSL